MTLTYQMVPTGHVTFVNWIIGQNVYDVAEKVSDGELLFKVPSLLVGERNPYNPSDWKHLRYARQYEGKHYELGFPVIDQKLRAALTYARLPLTRVPGGIDGIVPLYRGEILVANYAVNGSSGWIIQEEDKDFYLNALPGKTDSGKVNKLWVETLGDCDARLYGEDPTNDWPIIYRANDATRKVFLVEYDTGSLRILRIRRLPDEIQYPRVVCRVNPVDKILITGGRLPIEYAEPPQEELEESEPFLYYPEVPLVETANAGFDD